MSNRWPIISDSGEFLSTPPGTICSAPFVESGWLVFTYITLNGGYLLSTLQTSCTSSCAFVLSIDRHYSKVETILKRDWQFGDFILFSFFHFCYIVRSMKFIYLSEFVRGQTICRVGVTWLCYSQQMSSQLIVKLKFRSDKWSFALQ